jgi:AraC family transcriptional regulator
MLRDMTENAGHAIETADPLERARARIAASPTDAMTLAALAATAGLSTYHFVRAFTARYGAPPMAYLRARRLGAAAERLTAKRPPALIELAFDCGFESQEGFTRAFKRAFGVSPGRFKRATPIPSTEFPMPASVADLPDIRLTMESAPVNKPGFRVAGISGVFDETNRWQIPQLWGRLDPHLPLPGQTGDGASFGVCFPTEKGAEGCFRYMAAVPIAAEAPTPAALETADVPAQSYLVFRQVTDGSPLHPQMQAAVAEIWGQRVPRGGLKLAGGPDLEAYQPDFRPDRAGDWVEWWIPVET